MRFFLFIMCYWFCLLSAGAQSKDTTEQLSVDAYHTKPFTPKPNRAALYSALLPGAGQFYNKRYLKIPFIYAGLGYLIYKIDQNAAYYNCFKDAHRTALLEGNIPNQLNCRNRNFDLRNFSAAGLKQRRDAFRKNMELAYIGTGLVYLLNIVDAYVDAHLQDFDLSEDLAIQIGPFLRPESASYIGFSARLFFRPGGKKL